MPLRYWNVKPSDTTKDYVRFYWFLESDEPYTHHSMADICPELVFHYHGRFNELFADGHHELSFLAGLNAPSNRTRQFSIDQNFGMFGVYLYPHAIPMLFDIEASDLTNQMVDIHTLSRKYGSELEDQIMVSRTPAERIHIVESFVARRLQKQQQDDLPVFKAIQYIMGSGAPPTVTDLARDYFISERQLERQFRKFTGFSPKQFIRIARFQRTIQYYGREDFRLTDVALNCGYYDQSHFINDFKQFSGLNPRELFAGNSSAMRWKD